MDHFGGLDVSVKETSICIVDDTGRIVKEVKVASEPAALLKVLGNPTYRFKRIGLEAGPLSQWLFSALAEAELPVICVETRHMQAVLKAQINKTDRNDARGRCLRWVLVVQKRIGGSIDDQGFSRPGWVCNSRRTHGGGDPYRDLVCAHMLEQIGQRLRVTNVANGKSVVSKVADKGPNRRFWPRREIDLTPPASRAIGCDGMCNVSLERVAE